MSLLKQSSSFRGSIENRNLFVFLPLIKQEVDKEGSAEVIYASVYH